MYLVSVAVKESKIDGNGVFTLQDIKSGYVVWKFDPAHDKTMTRSEFDALGKEDKENLRRIAYFSKNTERWVYPPENDPALYTNHSKENNLSAVFDKEISEEPIFVANRDIAVDEELTNNYNEFDDFTQNSESEWLK